MYRSANTLRRSVSLRMETLEDRRLLAVDLVADIAPGSASSTPRPFVVAGENLFFPAFYGEQLLRLDFNEQVNVVHDFPPARSSRIMHVVPFENDVMFFKERDDFRFDLWKTVGSGTRAELVRTFDAVITSATERDGNLLFSGVSPEGTPRIWSSDGTSLGTVELENEHRISIVERVGDDFYFVASEGREIWRTNSFLSDPKIAIKPTWAAGIFSQGSSNGYINDLEPIDGRLGYQLCAGIEHYDSMCQWHFFDQSEQPVPDSYEPLQIGSNLGVQFNGETYLSHWNKETGIELYKRVDESQTAEQTVQFSRQDFSIDESGQFIGPAIKLVRSSGVGVRSVEVSVHLDNAPVDDFAGFSGRRYEYQEYIVTFQENEMEKVIPVSAFTEREIDEFNMDYFSTGLEVETQGDAIFTLRDDRILQGDRQVSLWLWHRDARLNPMGATKATVAIVDNETLGANAFSTNGITKIIAGGESETLDIQLTSRPTENVTVEVRYDDAVVTASPVRFEFTPENWNQAQLLYVQGGSKHGSTVIHLDASSETGEFFDAPVTSRFDLNIEVPPRFEEIMPNFEVVDWNVEQEGGSRVKGMVSANDALYFGADSGEFDTNLQLWKTNDSGEIFLVHALPEELQAFNGEVNRFIPVGDKFIFTLEWTPQCLRVCETVYDWWKTDGTREGTKELVPSYAYFNVEDLRFSRDLHGPRHYDLGADGWLYFEDGRGRGSRYDGANVESLPVPLTLLHAHGDSIYFVTDDQLWRTDDGFVSMVRIGGNDLKGSVFIRSIGESVYFTGNAFYNDLVGQYELRSLYRVNEQSALAETVYDSQVGIVWPAVVGERLFFIAESGLWVISNDMEEPKLLQSLPVKNWQLAAADGLLYLLGTHSLSGNELWRSDGTSEGTHLVNAHAASGPSNITTVGDKAFFTVKKGRFGRELWFSDGTVEGTRIYPGLVPGVSFSPFDTLTHHGDYLYFTATDTSGDSKLWRTNVERAFADPLPGDADGDQSVTFADFLVLSGNFGQTTDAGFSAGDFDESGNVDMDDFLLLAANFGK